MFEKLKKNFLEELKTIEVCCVSTLQGKQIKNRMMHFAYSEENFEFYLASLKDDPKINQMLINNEISILVYKKGQQFPEDKEIEITGKVTLINDENEKKKAIKLLINRSPVVKNLYETNLINMLKFIKVKPIQIKYRIVKDILHGNPPYLLIFQKLSSSIKDDLNQIKKKLKAWIIAFRYHFLTVSIIPSIFGSALAWNKTQTFNFVNFLLTLFGVIFLHLGTNLINDYFDHKSENDEVNNEFIRPFSGGSRVIQLGLLSSSEILMGSFLFFISGILIGIYLTYKIGIMILFLGIFGVFSGIFYTSPFLKLINTGMGEILVGLNFGILVSWGSYYVQIQKFNMDIILLSVPLGLLISLILIINEIPDYDADKKTSKNSLVVKLGKENTICLFKYLFVLNIIYILFIFIFNIAPKYIIISLITIPIFYKIYQYLKKYYNNSFELAPANGLMILSFNITSIIFIISTLINKLNVYYLITITILAIIYIIWHSQTIKKHEISFLKLKGI